MHAASPLNLIEDPGGPDCPRHPVVESSRGGMHAHALPTFERGGDDEDTLRWERAWCMCSPASTSRTHCSSLAACCSHTLYTHMPRLGLVQPLINTTKHSCENNAIETARFVVFLFFDVGANRPVEVKHRFRTGGTWLRTNKALVRPGGALIG
jgi:hypothetical protein